MQRFFHDELRQLRDDLILNRRVRLTDPAASADAHSSLQRVS